MDTAVSEFPFVQEMPKREKSKLGKLWDEFRKLQAVARERGAFVPPGIAATLLGVSHQRVGELVKLGRFEAVYIDGRTFILEQSIIDYAESERKSGRPWPGPKSYSEAAKLALKGGRESLKNTLK